MKFAIIALMLIVPLSGCASPPHGSAGSEYDKAIVPDVIVYPQTVLDKTIVELQSNSCPAMTELVIDYGVMRDQARVALGKKVDVQR